MSDEGPLPGVDPDEAVGDQSDQASRLQEYEEQQAIDAALGRPSPPAGDVLDRDYIARLTEDD
jgi:hypothetical protein